MSSGHNQNYIDDNDKSIFFPRCKNLITLLLTPASKVMGIQKEKVFLIVDMTFWIQSYFTSRVQDEDDCLSWILYSLLGCWCCMYCWGLYIGLTFCILIACNIHCTICTPPINPEKIQSSFHRVVATNCDDILFLSTNIELRFWNPPVAWPCGR